MFDDLASCDFCVSIFIKDDFQTFDLPTNANSGSSHSGHCVIFVLLFINFDVSIFIYFFEFLKNFLQIIIRPQS